MDTASVILAVASPPGRSVRGIVRVSGDAAFDVLRPHLTCAWSRGAQRARLGVAGLDVACLVLVFPGPGSYSGEDSVEIQLPGNPCLLERVVDALIESGGDRGLDARRAEAGEFTARAFLNGKMSLTEAEGVAATIAARSDAELRAARQLSSGRLAALACELADELAAALALVEAGIDFTDQEDVVAISPEALFNRLLALRDRIEGQLSRSVPTEQLEAIPWVVLTGEPNAGKSTLFNALLGRPRVVVSGIAGTTRDAITEPLTIDTPHGRAEVMLVDLAGAADDRTKALDRLMQSAARLALERADLVLRCIPAGAEAATSRASGRAPSLIVRTKCDLGHGGDLAVSGHTGEGLDQLRAAIAERLTDRAVSIAADTMALRPRHWAALRAAGRNLREAIELLQPARLERTLPQPELIAAAMRSSLNDLAALSGDIAPDDVLGRIFATFCVGK